jgi:hypothetical protein
MFHVEQAVGLSSSIRCFRLHFDVGISAEEAAPEVAGKADRELRYAPSAAPDLRGKDRLREFWKSEVG